MTEDLGPRLQKQFGPKGLRTLTSQALAGTALPPASVAALAAGVPVQVGPYFSATDRESLTLGDHASAIDARRLSPTLSSWCRLGTDRGAEICVGPSGAVQAIFIVTDAAPLHVNDTVEAFLDSLIALDRALPVLRSPGRKDPLDVFRELRARLLQIDAAPLQDDESWWSRVLELIRHAVSFPASVAFEVESPGGRRHIETEQTRVGVEHPEHLLWDRLEAQGVRPGQITRIYTELEPCFMPGNYCAMWLTQFPNAEFTYSHDYGQTAAEREAGLLELMQNAASNR
ncbi:nucleic acid/nucleotide deaminase domain-containing protein [Actinomadura sp. WMMB 499]|uniref:nucleic acid/nucleotide deaminase domain-containing protein n=1 Tax=Actinomadura sp. WMMB 499 TaxID=1219491 RepID=UPI001247EBD6|nr:nucleic acid/nucleotide deaminase domain-containing protein [Actinomadura sp. WMMB 499]QFG22487.1 hypothetical protein F7P10_16505 [Actinomadura sp. WMMB 499]